MKTLKSLTILLCLLGIGKLAFARAADVVYSKVDCEAFTLKDYNLKGITGETQALVLKSLGRPEATTPRFKNKVESEDGKAIFEGNPAQCTTKSCSGIIRGKKLLCGDGKTGENCKAIVTGDAGKCVDILKPKS
jgi:hypothetical protein